MDIQQKVLHDGTAGSKANPLIVSGTHVAGDSLEHCIFTCILVRKHRSCYLCWLAMSYAWQEFCFGLSIHDGYLDEKPLISFACSRYCLSRHHEGDHTQRSDLQLTAFSLHYNPTSALTRHF